MIFLMNLILFYNKLNRGWIRYLRNLIKIIVDRWIRLRLLMLLLRSWSNKGRRLIQRLSSNNLIWWISTKMAWCQRKKLHLSCIQWLKLLKNKWELKNVSFTKFNYLKVRKVKIKIKEIRVWRKRLKVVLVEINKN